MEIKIVVAGDVVVQPNYNSKLSPSILDDKFARILKESDYSIVNFEAPVKTKYSRPIIKTGPNLSQSADVIDLLKNVGFNCFTLANNHFRDYGHDACINTLTLLKAKGIDYLGAGVDIQEASTILYKSISNINFAFINVCEREWSIAADKRAGSNPVHPLTQYYQIREAKSKADYVVLIHHGGVEQYQLPSPEMKQLHRFFIDAGADAVINHHQHCFSGYEMYRDKPIFYGLGNFLFDKKGKINIAWNYGYTVELKFNIETRMVSFELFPYEQCNGKFGVFDRINKESFKCEIHELNKIIADDNNLRDSWIKYVSMNRSFYNLTIIPFRSRIFNKLSRMNVLPSFMSKYQLRFIYDVVNCNSHRNRFIDYLESKIKD